MGTITKLILAEIFKVRQTPAGSYFMHGDHFTFNERTLKLIDSYVIRIGQVAKSFRIWRATDIRGI